MIPGQHFDSEHIPWIQKKFKNGLPPDALPLIIEKLRGTEPALRNIIANIDEDILEIKFPGRWSVKEHIGHLHDLEQLHLKRLDDFRKRRNILSPADMSNKKTESAGHNNSSPEQLLMMFQSSRQKFIGRLAGFDQSDLQFSSMHPRLNILMNPVDIAEFVFEHDRHHLQTINAFITHHP